MALGRRIRVFISRNTFLFGPLLFFFVLLTIAALSRQQFAQVLSVLEQIVRDSGAWGQGLLVGMFVMATLSAVFPLSLLAVIAGVAYGLAHGFMLSLFGLLLGAAAAFLIGRYVFRSTIDHWLQRRVSMMRLDDEIGRQGFKIVALIRLSPLTPFSIASYALSMTRVSFGAYLAGTISGAPALFAYVYTGSISSVAVQALVDGSFEFSPVKVTIMGVGFLATVAVVLVLVRITRSALNRQPPG